MAYIGKKPEDKFRGLASYDTFTGDGSTTTFDVTNILPDGGTYDVEVFVDNVRQEGGAGKSYTIGNDGNGDLKRITFAVAPDNLSEIYVINPGRNTAVVTVTDNSLTAAKLQTDAVTTAKIQDDAVTNAKIGPAAVGATEISPGSITTTQISPSAAITNSQLANNAITINGTSIALGASGEIVAGTDWQAVVVADGSTTVNASAGQGYFLDTNAGVVEVFLPTSPTRGDTIILMDYAGTFADNNVIVNTGTANLDSTTTQQYRLTTNDTIAEFVYVDSAKGWVTRINTTTGTTPDGVFTAGLYDTDAEFIEATGGTVTTTGSYKIHTFTGDGCFVVSQTGSNGGPAEVDYMVVAGGGGSGTTGGGGAGGLRASSGADSGCYSAGPAPIVGCVSGITVSATTYPITVGSGGASGPGSPINTNGSPGNNSVFSTITSTGGGYGGGRGQNGAPGGSGGGAGDYAPGSSGGTGNSPPVSPPQGNNGGSGSPSEAGGGGGGATTAGGNQNGVRGTGLCSSITNSSARYAEGGAGDCGERWDSGPAGLSPGANLGYGGNPSQAGTDGVVIIRYRYQ